MDRITKQMLLKKLKTLGELTDTPTSSNDATNEGKTQYLALDHNSVYGGYTIVLVRLPNYSETSPFGYARLSARLMFDKLTDIISGIYISKKMSQNEPPF